MNDIAIDGWILLLTFAKKNVLPILFTDAGKGHGAYRVVSYRTPICVLGHTRKNMTYGAVSPIRRIGYGVSEGPGALSCHYVYQAKSMMLCDDKIYAWHTYDVLHA